MADQAGVAAVDRALAILDALTDERVSLAELAKRTGMYKSTVLRLLKSLEKAGYVLRTVDGAYRLGSKVLSLGALYQRYFRTSDIVPPVLEKLAAELHEGATFYICEGDQRVCLHRVDSTRAIRDSVHVGDRLPLAVGAAGHVLSAFNDGRGERLDEIRRTMVAASFGERDAETAAVAAPVFGSGNRLMGALSISGPRYRFEAADQTRLRQVLVEHAKLLTRILGGNPDDPAFSGWNRPAQTPPTAKTGQPARAARPARKTDAVRTVRAPARARRR